MRTVASLVVLLTFCPTSSAQLDDFAKEFGLATLELKHLTLKFERDRFVLAKDTAAFFGDQLKVLKRAWSDKEVAEKEAAEMTTIVCDLTRTLPPLVMPKWCSQEIAPLLHAKANNDGYPAKPTVFQKRLIEAATGKKARAETMVALLNESLTIVGEQTKELERQIRTFDEPLAKIEAAIEKLKKKK